MAQAKIGPAALAAAIGGLVTLAAAMGIGRFVYTPILPYMAESLRLSSSEAGLIASANFLGYLLGAMAAAYDALPGSRRRWCLGALALSALTGMAMGLTDSLWAFVALRFVSGIASAFALVFSSALILDLLQARGRPGLSAVYFAGVGTGIALSAMLISGLAEAGYGWRAHWVVSGALALAALAAAAMLLPDATEPERVPPPAGDLSAGRRLRALIAAYGLFGFGYVITATFISVIVRADPAIRHLEFWAWLVVGLTAAPSVWLWNRAGARMGTGHAFALACVLEGLGVALSVLAPGALGILVASALLGGTFMGLAALGLNKARELTTGDVRPVMAWITASFGLGQMVGPLVAGVVSDATGSFLFPSLGAAAALLISAGLGIYAAGPPRTP